MHWYNCIKGDHKAAFFMYAYKKMHFIMEDTCIFQKKIVILQLDLCAQACNARVRAHRASVYL